MAQPCHSGDLSMPSGGQLERFLVVLVGRFEAKKPLGMPSDSTYFWLDIFGEFVCWNQVEISGDLLKVPIAACSKNEKTHG